MCNCLSNDARMEKGFKLNFLKICFRKVLHSPESTCLFHNYLTYQVACVPENDPFFKSV